MNHKAKAIKKKVDPEVEHHRSRWQKVAKDNKWESGPTYLHVFRDKKTKKIRDTVSHKGLTKDVTSYHNYPPEGVDINEWWHGRA